PRAVLLLPRNAATSALTNLSVRAGLRASEPLIAGVVIAGAGERELLARGIGPGLDGLVADGIAIAGDPRLVVYDNANAPLISNDDWAGDPDLRNAFDLVGAFLLPENSRDSALLAPFGNEHTAHIGSASDGVGLIELYDTQTAAAASRLVNFSARHQVGIGSEILIAGFAIEGPGMKTLLIRGIGPGLASHGVTGHLVNSHVAVYGSDGARVAENDDWPANLAAVFAEAGAFPLTEGSEDAALVVALAAGTYTVQLSGVSNQTGEGLIEIYDLDL
ncbi:MAG: hypothetical protein ACREIA_20030, partial [Opitutaceae bacterium]